MGSSIKEKVKNKNNFEKFVRENIPNGDSIVDAAKDKFEEVRYSSAEQSEEVFKTLEKAVNQLQ